MDASHLLLAGLANFMFIGLKAFQQLNVIHNNYVLVILTSHLLAFGEVFVIYTIAAQGYFLPLVLTIGVSGAAGCLFAMRFHNWFKKAKGTSTEG